MAETAIDLAGHPVALDPAGALWIAASRTLVVADLHLEKGSSLARRQVFLPPYDTHATLQALGLLIARRDPRRVICLGDSFHDRQGAAALPLPLQQQITGLMAGRDWFWIAGNHDPDHPEGLGGDCVQELYLDGLCFRHEPAQNAAEAVGEVAGHLHPAARVVRRGKGVRRPCFACDGLRLIMPSFGVTTGGLNLRNRAFAGLFDPRRLTAHLLGRERIYSVAFDRLIG